MALGHLGTLIAQSRWPDSALWVPVAYLAGIVLVVGIGMAILSVVCHRMAADQAEGESGFTLSSARELRNQGLVTEEEYAQIRQKVVGDPVPAPKRAGNALER